MQLETEVKRELPENITVIEKDITNKTNALKRFVIDRQNIIAGSILAKYDNLCSTLPGGICFFSQLTDDLNQTDPDQTDELDQADKLDLRTQFPQIEEQLNQKLIEIGKYLSQLESELEVFYEMETELTNQISTYSDLIIDHLNRLTNPSFSQINEKLESIKSETAKVLNTKNQIERLLKFSTEFKELPDENLEYFSAYLQNYEKQVYNLNCFCNDKLKELADALKNEETNLGILSENLAKIPKNNNIAQNFKMTLYHFLKDSQEGVNYLLEIKNRLNNTKEELSERLSIFSGEAEKFSSKYNQAFAHIYLICTHSSILRNRETCKELINDTNSLLNNYQTINNRIQGIIGNSPVVAPFKRAEPFADVEEDTEDNSPKLFKKN